MSSYITLSAFQEKHVLDDTDFIVGYQSPAALSAERRWKFENLSKSLSGDYLPIKTVIPVSKIGTPDYLDLDMKGSFKGGQATTSAISYILQERDGTFMGLREGNNGILNKAFYFYAKNANLSDMVITDIEYQPAFLLTNEYVSKIVDGNEHGICVEVKNTTSAVTKVLWVNVDGTLNDATHTTSSTVNVTGLFTTHNLSSLVYVKELNYFIGTVVGTGADWGKFFYYVFNSGLTLISNGGVRWLQVDFRDFTHINYGTWSGENTVNFTAGSNIGVIGINHTQRPNLHYTVSGTTIFISQFVGIHAHYPSAARYIHYVSACQYNTGTNTFADVYSKPYNFSFDVVGNRTIPFFEKAGPGQPSGTTWGSWFNIAQTKFYFIGNTIYEATKEHGWRTHDFAFRVHSLLTTKQDAILAPYRRTPNPPAAWSETPSYFIPFDGALTGKTLLETLFVSPTKIYTRAQSRLPSDPGLVTRHVLVEQPNITSTINTPRFVDNVNITRLSSPPTSIISYPLTPPNFNYHPNNYSQGNSLITTLDSIGNMRVRAFNRSTREIFDQNADTGALIGTPIVLPTDYVAQINTLYLGFAERTGATVVTTNPSDKRAPNWTIFYLNNNYFLLNYAYFFPGVGVRVYIRMLQLAGTTLNTVGSSIVIETLNFAWPPSTTWSLIPNGYPRQFDPSAGIYFSSTPNICFILFNSIGSETPGTNSVPNAVAEINTSTGTIVRSQLVNSSREPTWHRPQCGIHPSFGPYRSESHYDFFTKTPIYFRDRRSIVETIQTKMTTIFNDLFANNPLNTELIILTLEGSVGFYIYVSETPVFIKGNAYKIPNQTIDLVTTIGGGNPALVRNKTFFTYVEVVLDQAIITFYNTKIPDTDSRIYIGSFSTNNTGLTTSAFKKVSRFGTMQMEDKITTSGSAITTNEFIKVRIGNLDKYIRLFDI